MNEAHTIAALVHVASLGPHVRELQLLVTKSDGRSSIEDVLTVGYDRQTLLSAASQDQPSELPSAFTSLASESSLSLAPIWSAFSDGAQQGYQAMLRNKSGASGAANGLNSSLTRSVLAPGTVDIRPRALADDEAQAPALPNLRGQTSRLLVQGAAGYVDAALRRPLGGIVTSLAEGGGLETRRLDTNPVPGSPAPLYVGSEGPSDRFLAFWNEHGLGGWDSEESLGASLIAGPGRMATQLLQAALDVNREAQPGTPREEMRWVRNGGSSLPPRGNTHGQPDFCLEYRAGPDQAWTVLVTGEIKLFVASPLLVQLLRVLRQEGSAPLGQGSLAPRPAWDRCLTQMSQQLAASGANCGLLWTGIDWIIVDRVRPSGTAKVALEVWPKLLRSPHLRSANRTESGSELEPGTTRHDAGPHVPAPDEEECELNEVGILVAIGLHARELRRRDVHERSHLPQIRRVGFPSTSTSGGSTNAPPRQGAGDVIFEGQAFAGGSYASVDRARSHADGTLVVKLARFAPPPEVERWEKWDRRGPESFAVYARQRLALEAEAYGQAAELQGSVLPVLKAVIPAEPLPGEEQDPGTGLESLGSTSSSSASLDAPRSPATPPLETSSPSSASGTGATLPSDPTREEPVTQSSELEQPMPRPARLDGLVLTWAGDALSSLAPDPERAQIDGEDDDAPPAAVPKLGDLLSECGIATASEASQLLSTAVVSALEALHSRGVAHGDVSMANICLSPSPPYTGHDDRRRELEVRLIDLGNAALLRQTHPSDFAALCRQDLARAHDAIAEAVARTWPVSHHGADVASRRSLSLTPTPVSEE